MGDKKTQDRHVSLCETSKLMIKILIIEDDATIRNNLVAFIEFQADIELVANFESIEDFISESSKKDIDGDILILDIGLPGMSGIKGIPLIKKIIPAIDIIMLTTYDDDDMILGALQSGACSYLSKKTALEEIINSIRLVSQGGSYMSPAIARKLANTFYNEKQIRNEFKLSPKQSEVIKHLVNGLSYKAIAQQMNVTTATIKTHIKRIYETLHVNNKAEAISKYLKG